MRFENFSILALGTLLGSAASQACNKNNCLRAVIASAFTTRDGKADCSSYMAVTVTPATSTFSAIETTTYTTLRSSTKPVTTTVYQTVLQTSTATFTAGTRTIYQRGLRYKHVRQITVSASNIPAYASPCAGPAAYSSACSCIGVTRYTVTVNAPVATQSSTATVLQTQDVEVTQVVTVSEAVTRTVEVQTTVTPILVKPKICNARGLPGANAFNYDANFNTNQAACLASCKTDNRCLSTGFYIVTDPGSGTQTGTCRKYDKSVTDSADLGFGYYNWNDKAC